MLKLQVQHKPEVETQISEPRPQRIKKTSKHLQNFITLAADYKPDQTSATEV